MAKLRHVNISNSTMWQCKPRLIWSQYIFIYRQHGIRNCDSCWVYRHVIFSVSISMHVPQSHFYHQVPWFPSDFLKCLSWVSFDIFIENSRVRLIKQYKRYEYMLSLYFCWNYIENLILTSATLHINWSVSYSDHGCVHTLYIFPSDYRLIFFLILDAREEKIEQMRL